MRRPHNCEKASQLKDSCMRPLRAGVFVLCLLASTLLATGCAEKKEEAQKLEPDKKEQAQKLERQKEEQAQRLKRQKDELDKKSCFAAYRALRKIEALLDSGAAFREYSKSVSHAKLEINLTKKGSARAQKLEKVFNYYQTAKNLWRARIADAANLHAAARQDAADLYAGAGQEVIRQLEIVEELLPGSNLLSYQPDYDWKDVERAKQLLWAEGSRLLGDYE